MSDLATQLDASKRHQGQSTPRQRGHIFGSLSIVEKARSYPIVLSIISGVALTAAIVIATAITIVNLRDRELSNTETGLRNLSLVLAEQSDRSFQSVELVQKTLTDRMQTLRITTSEDYERQMSGHDTYVTLKNIISGLPQIDAITMIDKQGKLINFSRYWPIPAVNVSDRDYFKALKSNPSLMSFVSVPVHNRGTGTWTIYIARKVSGPNGEFLGLVLGAMKMKYFEEFYKKVTQGAGGSISLIRRDGILLARYPHVEASIGKSFASNPLFSSVISNANSRAVRMIDAIDHDDRLIAASTLPNYPIVVAVGTTVTAALANWRIGAIRMTSFTALLAIVVGGITFLTWRQIAKRLYATNLELDHMAHHDFLTGLPNRKSFSETIGSILDRAATTREQVAVLSVDLDRFKDANDIYGHIVGDGVLREISRRMQSAAGGAFLARIGGDEFMVLVKEGAQPAAAAALADRLLATLERDIEVEGHYIKLGMSIGVAVYPTDGADAKTLILNADAALYRAKAETRGAALFFESEMSERLRERLKLQEDLRSAIDRNELLLHYQPQVRMTGETVGFEALARWRCPKRGMVPPDKFIPIAEASNLIISIGEWVLREACREAASWSQPLTIAVNVSPIQFLHGDLPRLVHTILLETGLAPGRLELEITESVMINDFSRAISILNRLKSLGVRIAMDDFGTGYSSLSHLQAFRYDKIKIDRGFISDLETNRHSRAITHAAIGLSKSLDLLILAEGVETEAQHEFLVQEGCDEVQGYLTGRPLPIADYAELVGRQAVAKQNYAVAG